ncbi:MULTISPECIES: LutC/YkgG family protein [unclassified Helicobacter]|uniref:LutC/YkgG family protein n=1 Tax=unclassified Helicobacter TaxID=2593540 RepID=UPI000CF11AD9|nr:MULTISPECIES: lactate utilization protein C [unclassified Helicobacter]
MSKAKILQSISQALIQNPLQNEQAIYQDIIIPQEQDKIKEYKRLQEANKAEVFDIQKDEISQILNEIFQRENISQTLISASLQKEIDISIPTLVYDTPMEIIKDKLFSIECGILQADYGISNLGVITLTSNHNQPRLLSLITKHCIILLEKNKILSNLSEAITAIKRNYPDVLPSNILFIAGPSRTADIELQVVFGVHGPQKVYVLLY